MVGNFKERKALDIKLGELKADLEILEKYEAEDNLDQCNAIIRLVEEQIQLLNNRAISCCKCGHLLSKEERIYADAGSMGGDRGPVAYFLWDTFVCLNCGYFTWDEDSRRSMGGYGDVDLSDPRYKGTMDGKPSCDPDNERWR